MPLLFGLVIGFLVWTHLFAFICPLLALLNFIVGRFFIAAVLMMIGLWCFTFVDDTLKVTPDEYKVLLVLGLLLEGIKLAIRRINREEQLPEIVLNIVDEDEGPPPMKDVTPRIQRLVSPRSRSPAPKA